MSRALLFLLVRSWRGRIVQILRRLKQPKYLLGFLVGAGWVLFWLSGPLLGTGTDGSVRFGVEPEWLEPLRGPAGLAAHMTLALLLAVVVTVWWLVPLGRPTLEYTEPELHLLLPAPVARRQLIQYGLFKSQGGVLIGVTIMTFFTTSGSLLERLPTFVTLWVLFTVWDLHAKARGLWIARNRELRAGARWRRRGILVAMIAGMWLAIGIGLVDLVSRVAATLPWPEEDLVDTAAAVFGDLAPEVWSGPLGWALSPFLLLLAPVFRGFSSPDASGPLLFVGSWIGPLALLVLHNEWVVRSRTGFEEAALEHARRKNREADPAAKFWKRSLRTRTWTAFKMAPLGAPEVAIVWKNLMLVRRMRLRTVVGAGAAIAIAFVLLLSSPLTPNWLFGSVYAIAAGLMVFPALAAGRSLRNDLRADLLKVEVIRPWPLRGWRLFAAEVAAPVLLAWLQVGWGALLLVGLDIAMTLGPPERGGAVRDIVAATLGVSSSVVVPLGLLAALPLIAMIATLASALENLATLAFPSWMHLGIDKKQAAAKFGQNLIVFMALSLAMLCGIAPGAILVGLVVAIQIFVWGVPISGWELPFLGLLASAPIAAVCVGLVRSGGALWDRLDPSEELLAGRA